LAIVTLVLWVVTAAAGVSLLSTGGAARRQARAAAAADTAPAAQTEPTASREPAVGTAAARSTGPGVRTAAARSTGPGAGTQARVAAIPMTADGKPPPVPRVRVVTPPGEHPLLEFCHPALALTGLACWFMFVLVHYRTFAWIAFCILVVTMAFGLSWMARNTLERRRQVSAAWPFPRPLVLLHGAAAAVSITLTVLTALSAARG
jgi:hypothetical protein